jgi:hypothetical protein
MPWPSRSPDLNPIEHVWDLLNRRARSNNANISNLQELRTALIAECDSTETDSKNNPGNEETMQGRLRRVWRMDKILNFVLINEHLYYDSYCAPYNRKCCYNMCINWDRSMITVVITPLYKIFHQYCFTSKNTFCYKIEYPFVANFFFQYIW